LTFKKKCAILYKVTNFFKTMKHKSLNNNINYINFLHDLNEDDSLRMEFVNEITSMMEDNIYRYIESNCTTNGHYYLLSDFDINCITKSNQESINEQIK
jgi:hypothetical protein